ncbi:MAG: TonB-dependent receptor [Cyclobacteriaceae bacterium]|nr:TonB-dependent receptor [Cyclobacteriaceae bacterium]
MRRSLCLISLLFISMFSFAQTDTTIIMSDIMIHGNRINMPFSEVSRNMHIIGQEQIRRQPVQSIPEILSYTPGVDMRQRGPMGVQADIGIRGGTFEQTLILVNGMKLTDPQTGHHVMNIPMPLDNIKQIEVLKGPGARIYGQNAFAGAVNFITITPEFPRLGLRAYGGSFGSYGGNLSISLPFGAYKQYISFSKDVSDGYRHNTDYKIINGFYQSTLTVKNGSFDVLMGFTDRKFGANGFYAIPKYTEQYEEVRTGLASVAYVSEFQNFSIKPRVYWRWNEDNYLLVRDKPSTYQNLHETNTIGTEVNANYMSKFGISGLGVEYRKEEIAGEWVRGGNESKSNLDGFDRDNVGLYLDHLVQLGQKTDITAGVYVNWYSDFGWNAFPGLEAGYSLTDNIRLYGNIGTSYRVPTFYDQYYSSPLEQGNPNLKPEEALNYEVGARYLDHWYALEANVFVRDANELIDWVLDPVDSIWRTQNFQDVTTMGVELAMNFDFKKRMGSKFVLHNVSLSYNFLNQNLAEKAISTSRYNLENIRNQFIFTAGHRVVWKIKNSFNLRYIDRVEQSAYYLIDDRLYYESDKGLVFFLEVKNLTDKQYTEIMTPMPGRWIMAGCNFKIDF